MKVFVAGATGVIGRRLVPALVSAGHDVTGTSRSAQGVESIIALGGEGVVMDGLDPSRVRSVVVAAEPEVMIHQLTSIKTFDSKNFDASLAVTNRLRTEGTDNLLVAAIAAGASGFIAQSFTGWTNERIGGPVKSEQDPLDAFPSKSATESLDAIGHLESIVTGANRLEGLVVRYGNLYGPGTGFAVGGDIYEAVSDRKFPVVGHGTGVWSFIHVDDAVEATIQALDHGSRGLYNVVDDEPAPLSEWLPFLAEVVGAKPPRRLPVWMARPMVGEQGIRLMTEIRGSGNTKAKLELNWKPQYPSWRDGFGAAL